jgi:high-affinity Fe2+/Pb2+ permease
MNIIIYSIIAAFGLLTGIGMVLSGDIVNVILGIVMLIASNGMIYGIIKLHVLNSEEKAEKKTKTKAKTAKKKPAKRKK